MSTIRFVCGIVLIALLASGCGTDDAPPETWRIEATFGLDCTDPALCTRTLVVHHTGDATVTDAHGALSLSEAMTPSLLADWSDIVREFSESTCGPTQAADVAETLAVRVVRGDEEIHVADAGSCHGYGGEASDVVSALRATFDLVPEAYDCREWTAESLPFEPFDVDESTERFACF